MGVALPAQPLAVRRQGGVSPVSGSILVVDDDETSRHLFVELFRGEGVSVRVAASGQEALAMLKQSAPSLLIVDMTLPDQDGIAVLEEAQRIDDRIVGVAIIGAPSVELAVRAMKAGAIDVLVKPVQNDAVLMTVRRLLEIHRRQAENAVLKHAAVRAGHVKLRSVPLQTFGEDGSPCDPDASREFERGLAEGERRAEERLRQERALFVQAVRQLNEARTVLQQTIEDDVVALAFQIATKVLHEAADTAKDQIVIQAKSAISVIRESGAVVIEVHPADVPAVEAARSELLEQTEAPVALKIVPLPSVPRGTCLVHTANRMIDASLDSQLLRLGEALKNRGRRESR